MEDEMDPLMSGDYPAMDQPQGITKSGRVRKKSAKVLEMEEAEELEKKEQKKFIASLKNKNSATAAKSNPIAGSKKLLKSGAGPARPVAPPPVKAPPVTSPVKCNTTSPKLAAKLVVATSPSPPAVQLVSSPTSPVGSGSAIKFLLSSPVVETKAITVNASKKPIMNPVALQMALDVGAPPPSTAELEKNAKKSKSKKVGQMLMGPPPTLEIPVEQKPDPIRLKLLLSPKQETIVKEEPPPTPPQPVIPEVTFMTNLPEIAPPPVKKKKKIKKEPVTSPTPVSAVPVTSSLLSHLQSAPTPPSMLPTYEEHLAASEGDLIIDTEKKRKKPKVKKEKKEKGEKSEKKKNKKAMALEQSQMVQMLPNVVHMGQQHIQTDMGPVYSNTSEMAMKVKTSAEKKAGKSKKSKKSKEDPSKPKKKRAPTAYMLWCNHNRAQVVAENPGIDFATISKRLGEMWQELLEKEKMVWRRKAKKLAAKGSTLINITGKTGAKANMAAAPPTGLVKASKASSQAMLKIAGQSVTSPTRYDENSPLKSSACQPIDVAAHLKLLGESLSIIGARLQEHRGHIAVQGSLSVLLDSLVCALGPLASLTSQVPQMEGLNIPMHTKTLDNIAYIMPGIG